MVFKRIIKKIKNEKEVLEGKKTKDKIYTSIHKFPSEAKAIAEFKRSKQKLFDVNSWSRMPGFTSTFELHDSHGEKKTTGLPEKGDYVLIKLPGPLPDNWVEIIDVKEKDDFAEFVVSPSPKPQAEGEEKKEIEHFFIDEASSTFRVHREGDTILASEIGKNQGINNQGNAAADREWINTLIAEGGWLAFQRVQWKKLTDYLVHKLELEEE